MFLKLFLLAIITLTSCAYAQVNTEVLRSSGLKRGLNHQISTQYQLLSGNSSYSILKLNYRTDFKSPFYDGFMVVNSQQGLNNGDLFLNKAFLHLRLIFPLQARLKSELFTQREFDDFINLQDRQLFGAGLRFLPKQLHATFNWYFGSGLMWETEILRGYDDTSLIRCSNYLSLYLQQSHYQLSSITYYQPDIAHFSDYRVLSHNKWSFLVSKNMSFDTTFHIRYDNEPTGTLKKLDLELQQGFSISF